IVEASTTAADVLLTLLLPDNPPAVRLGAARSILDYTFRAQDIAPIHKRLADLEGKEEAVREQVELCRKLLVDLTNRRVPEPANRSLVNGHAVHRNVVARSP